MIDPRLPQLALLVFSGGATVAAVRFLMMPGVRGIARGLGLGPKATGQLIGYATSLPELTVLVAAGLSGVFEAGFWNIASSNIINAVLFGSAILVYRQQGELKERVFRDELAFVIASVAIPIGLVRVGVALNYATAFVLLGLFVAYRIIDTRVNAAELVQSTSLDVVAKGPAKKASLVVSLLLLLAGLVSVVLAGRALGRSAGHLVDQLGVPGWALGWILGLITSLPELTSFFEVFRARKADDLLDNTLADTQEALDALVSSNMCNLALILPIGTLCYLLVT